MATPGGPETVGPGEPNLPAPSSGPGGPPSVGLAANVAAALCYVPLCCLNVVWAIYVVAAEKESRFLRFHAFQSLLFNGVVLAASTVTWVLSHVIWFVGGLLSLLVLIVWVGGSLFLAFKAYSNEEFELPQLGALARQWS
jgi:uncharacterized membrane protein